MIRDCSPLVALRRAGAGRLFVQRLPVRHAAADKLVHELLARHPGEILIHRAYLRRFRAWGTG